MAPRPGALAAPEVVEVFGRVPVLGYPAPPFGRWLLPGWVSPGGNFAKKILGCFFAFWDEKCKNGKPFWREMDSGIFRPRPNKILKYVSGGAW